VLEVEIAGLAAERRSDADLQAMDALVQEARNGLANRDDFARNDVEFHAALARATGNPLFPLLLDAVADVLLEVRRTGYDVPGTPARALRHHADILQQVRLGDSEGARQAMRTHLSESWDTQSRAGNTPTPEPPY
jgi:GntR family transcriptional repressor for pyruvate dehydrogenase complex